jgi:hypothetical protein
METTMYRKMLLVVAAIAGAAVVFSPTGLRLVAAEEAAGAGGDSAEAAGEEDMAGVARPSALALVSGWPEAIRIIGVRITTEAVLITATLPTAGDAGGE